MNYQKTDFTNFATEHPNYFPGQYLLEDDFELQHKYLIDRQQYQNKSLYVSGIIEGLEVIPNGNKVQITSGSAINNLGQLIVLKADFDFSDFKGISNGELYIQYSETKDSTRQQQEKVADSSTRWIEKPQVGFAAEDKTPTDGVKLATLKISGDTITIDPQVRDYSGVSLPNSNGNTLTLRSGGNADPELAVLTGSLKIENDLKVTGAITIAGVGIGTDAPGDYKLKVQGNQLVSENLQVNGNVTAKNISLARKNDQRGALFLACAADFSHSIYNNNSNIDKEGKWDGAKWNVGAGLKIRPAPGREATLYIDSESGNVGIGTEAPGDYKLKVQGKTNIKGDLTVQQITSTGALKVSGTSTFSESLTVEGAITPSAGDLKTKGIMFPKDPGGGGGDAAWIRYYRRGASGEATNLEIGTSNDPDDHIFLNPSGGIGIGTKDPGNYKLNVQGNTNLNGNLTVTGQISGNINAEQITSGILSVDRIPPLSADKITGGTLSVDRIPQLSAAQITSGTLSVDRIPQLSAAQITTGTLNVERIPQISADKITSGSISGDVTVVGKLRVQGNIVNEVQTNIRNSVQTTLISVKDNATQKVLGTAQDGFAFLTKVIGEFAGPGEQVEVFINDQEQWILYARSGANYGLTAEAGYIDLKDFVRKGTWVEGRR